MGYIYILEKDKEIDIQFPYLNCLKMGLKNGFAGLKKYWYSIVVHLFTGDYGQSNTISIIFTITVKFGH